MSTHACFPSMKPLGMELGVRISYLRKRRGVRSFIPVQCMWPGMSVREGHPNSVADVEFLPRFQERRHLPFLRLMAQEASAFPAREHTLTVDYLTHSRASFRLGLLVANCPVSTSITPEGHSSLPETLLGRANTQDGPRTRGLRRDSSCH